MSKNQPQRPAPQVITDEDVAKAIRAYSTVSSGQALWAVFGHAHRHYELFKPALMAGGMRHALEAVARAYHEEARTAAAQRTAEITSLAREAASQYSRETGRLTLITGQDLGAWEGVVELVLSRAKVTL